MKYVAIFLGEIGMLDPVGYNTLRDYRRYSVQIFLFLRIIKHGHNPTSNIIP